MKIGIFACFSLLLAISGLSESNDKTFVSAEKSPLSDKPLAPVFTDVLSSVIPAPKLADWKPGAFVQVPRQWQLLKAANCDQEATLFANWLQRDSDIRMSVDAPFCLLLSSLSGRHFAPESYQMEISTDGIKIEAGDEAGFFYGLVTLWQLLQDHDFERLPIGQIVDEPALSWRGLHLDVSRHFFSVDEIKAFLERMAFYKFNVFHWHLTDGPGWRIEIKKYPRLTDVGAWRESRIGKPWNWRATDISEDGKRPNDYGGFYSQDDIREIVAFAAKRHITIVPEIEMPGHAYAALMAYPQFACPTNAIKTEGLRGKDVFCLGNEGTIPFLQDILTEVIPLFPGKYVHIGADEVPLLSWSNCPLCRQKLEDLSGDFYKDLQTDLVTKMAAFLKARGKTLIGWDEIIDEDLPKEATVMVWREGRFAEEALALGHDIIFCPTNYSYFDYYQGPKAQEPEAIGGFLPLEKVFNYQVPATKPGQGRVLGGQGNLWTEYMQTFEHLNYMAWPRAAALSQQLWQPTNDFKTFKRRLEKQLPWWPKQNWSFRPLK